MKSFRNVFGIVCLGIILVAGMRPGRAQEELEERTREETREEERLREQERLRDRERIMENEEKILGKYSERFGVETETLADLRAERFGYGEISHAFVLSEMTERSQNEIMAMRREGKGWGEIADELGVKLREARREVNRERRRINKELTREERRTFRNSWKERVRRREVTRERPRPRVKERKGPERGGGRGGGR